MRGLPDGEKKIISQHYSFECNRCLYSIIQYWHFLVKLIGRTVNHPLVQIGTMLKKAQINGESHASE